jgi:RNA recognition motif-containing protein
VPQAPSKPVKLTFWQKLKALFTGKKSAASSGKTNGTAPAKARPEYQPRTTTVQTPQRPARKPEAVEVTSPKLYIGNLSFDATESDLLELFKGVGSVQSAEVVSHKSSEKSKGFGFVVMATIDEAKRAVETLHDKEFMGRKLVVSGAKTSERTV